MNPGGGLATATAVIGRLKEHGAPTCEGLASKLPALTSSPQSVLGRIDALHEALPLQPDQARLLLDTHLLASYRRRSAPPPWLVLDARDAFHYHNLPNLVPALRSLLVTNAWEQDVLGVLMSPFCLHINRTARPRAYQPPSTRTTCAAAIGMLHGLMLGLYPFNIRQPRYERRVAIAGWLRGAVCAPRAASAAFLAAHLPLLTLAAIEYLANVVPDYCPVEAALLIRSPQCRFIVNHLCDTFRQEEEELAGSASSNTEQLNERASATLASVQRQLKLCNHRPCKRTSGRAAASVSGGGGANSSPAAATTTTAACPAGRVGLEDIREALRTPVVTPGSLNMVSQIQLLRPDLDFPRLQAIEAVWQQIIVHDLPRSVYRLQREALESKGSCTRMQATLTTVHLCMACALRSKPNLHQHRFSYDCAARRVVCTFCFGPAQCINLLGRVLMVRGINYFLCPTCLAPTPWRTGVTPCERCTPKPSAPPARCAACDSRSLVVRRDVVDYERMCMRTVALCSRHARACALRSEAITYDVRSLEADLAAFASAAATRRHHPRRPKIRVRR